MLTQRYTCTNQLLRAHTLPLSPSDSVLSTSVCLNLFQQHLLLDWLSTTLYRSMFPICRWIMSYQMSHGHWIYNTRQKGTHWFTVDEYFLRCEENLNITKCFETKAYTSRTSHRVALWSLHAKKKKKGPDNTNRGKKKSRCALYA